MPVGSLIEDNDVFRNALEVLLTLGGDIEIAGSEPDGDDVVERCRSSRRTCLVDYRLPGLDGVQVTRLVREQLPEVAVVALTRRGGGGGSRRCSTPGASPASARTGRSTRSSSRARRRLER
jgi:DNA-binding NarL/FixJ family response regulator